MVAPPKPLRLLVCAPSNKAVSGNETICDVTSFLPPFHHHLSPPSPAPVALEKFLQAGLSGVKVALVGVEDNLDEFSLLRGNSDEDHHGSSSSSSSSYYRGSERRDDFSFHHRDPVLPDYVRRCFDRLLRPMTAADVHVGMYRANIRAAIQACHDCVNGIHVFSKLRSSIYQHPPSILSLQPNTQSTLFPLSHIRYHRIEHNAIPTSNRTQQSLSITVIASIIAVVSSDGDGKGGR